MRFPRRARLLALLAPIACAACTEAGDLGRPRPSLLSEVVLPTAGIVSARERGEPASLLPFTDDEGELRDRAWRFLLPAGDRPALDRILAELSRTRVLPPLAEDPSAYYAALTVEPVRSPASLFAVLAGDAEADARLVEPFAATARRVVEADRSRSTALSAMPGIDPADAREAATRVAENQCLIAWVRRRAGERAVSYRYALDHLFVATPQREAIGAERALRMFLAHRPALDRLLRPDGACAAVSPSHGRVAAPPVVKG